MLELATSSSSSAVITGDDFKHKMKLVEQVMKSVHLAAAMEAMSLGKSIGLEPQMLFEIIKEAAGSSWMFVDRVPGVISGHWKEGRTVQDAVGELVWSDFLTCFPPTCMSFRTNSDERPKRWRKRIA